MIYKIVITTFAKKDILKGKIYYKEINIILAKQFLARIKEAKNYISENPLANDVMYRSVRLHFIKQFPYHIHYLVNQEKQEIVIIAVEFAKQGNLDFPEKQIGN